MSDEHTERIGGRQVAERGILFNGPMVRAILDGRKDETRRIIKLPGDTTHVRPSRGGEASHRAWVAHWIEPDGTEHGGTIIRCPYGIPGDLLYVRETWGVFDRGSVEPFEAGEEWTMPFPLDYALAYKATDEGPSTPATCVEAPAGHRILAVDDRWRSARFMPKWATRIWLRVENVWVERVQDITEAGALAEGFKANPYYLSDGTLDEAMSISARANFASSINEIYPGAWDRNDWMWGCRFSRTEAPHA